ncbi:DUF4287 domain-containing protein [Planctobacterium marinum]|uniref:DUF4287 domain-containing protein n=1 Tax=Planctobacterium marinum TaxID=1631968 RepID=UPI001E51225F|nr:DUF4287 domain-containing protein [Planctobacterium marinum]MCC2607589.1 DUF4287 domain-containing protein [Planctobacterium marinum]
MASPEQQSLSMLQNLPEKTGKPLAEWLGIIATQQLDKHGKIVGYLKTEHQITHGFANLIAHEYLNQDKADEPDLVAQQYSGGKEGLLPIYEALISAIQSFAADLEIAPKKAYVSLRRNKQFALIQPSTKTRLDLGINLKGTAATERLENAGSFNAMVSHRVRITDSKQIDDELIRWLKAAWQSA